MPTQIPPGTRLRVLATTTLAVAAPLIFFVVETAGRRGYS